MIKQTSSFSLYLFLFLVLMNHPAQSQTIISPDVHPDRSVTFRLRAPNAQKVMLAREGAEAIAMQKDTDGVWSVTTPPLDPDIYGYSFIVDDVAMFDPSNPVIKNNFLYTSSQVYIPGPDSLPWQENNVPHGIVHHHYYHSAVVGDNRDFYVYTPPDYNPTASRKYPVLYLLHGYSDDASAWTAVGRAQFILDNLIAEGKATPMIVVMPLGYGAPEIVTKNARGLGDAALRERNYQKFREALLTEVVPQVEKSYRALSDRNARAIAGLSMGGAESLFTGLNDLDRFAWIGAFSSGGMDDNLDTMFDSLPPDPNTQLRLLWISCGTEDGLLRVNRALDKWLDSKGIRHKQIETPGSHTWMVWRRNLASFVPLLFHDPTQ
jgi:enterochelin esterase-like enzyme